MSGRPRTPSAIAILRGNPGRRPLNHREPDVAPITELPKPPGYLGRIARTLRKLKGAQLIQARVLTPLDLEALDRLCYWEKFSSGLREN